MFETPDPKYRIYTLDGLHILKGDWLEAASDEEAIIAARATNPGSKCEIWDGHRLVTTIDAIRLSA